MLIVWALAGSAAISGAAALVTFALLPGYKLPTNRLYPTPFGYPSILRFLGKPIPVEVATVGPAMLSEIIMGRGLIDPEEIVQVSARAIAKVTRVLVDVGMQVEEGEPLIFLDTTQAQNAVRIAEANLTLAEINLATLQAGARPEAIRERQINVERAKGNMEMVFEQYMRERRLFEQGVISKANLEGYESNYHNAQAGYLAAVENLAMAKTARAEHLKAAEAQLESVKVHLAVQKENLEEARIYSPTDGVVIGRSVNRGEVPGVTGQVLLSIARGFTFKADVDQEKTGQVRLGQEAEVFLDAYPGRTFKGKVIKINPAIQSLQSQRQTLSEQDRRPPTFPVWITLDHAGEPLAPGLLGFARIQLERDGLAMPAGALIHFSAGEGLVCVVEDCRIRVRPVKFGITSKGMTEIIQGLKEGEQVIISGQQALKEGDQIEVVE